MKWEREKNHAEDGKRWKIHRKISFVKLFPAVVVSFVFDAGVIVALVSSSLLLLVAVILMRHL